MKTAGVALLAAAVLVGAGVGLWLLSSTGEGEAGPRADFEQNSEFFKRGRSEFAICVSDYTDPSANISDLSARVERAVEENKAALWKGSFLEVEDIKVDSPCPKGPTFDERTANLMEQLGNIPIVDEPGAFILYVHVVGPELLATIDRLKLGGRIMPQELFDDSPNQIAGYVQVAAALYLSRTEFEQPEYLARQVAEALGCTEDCAGPAR